MAFSKIESEIGKLADKIESERAFRRVTPFPPAEMTAGARSERLGRCAENYWEFDRTYFTTDMYSEGYSAPAEFHKNLLEISQTPGVQVVLGARKHGKTAFNKKFLVWRLLTGKVSFAGTLSETLPTARNILNDIFTLISDNERIIFDYRPRFTESNGDQLTFQLPNSRRTCRVMAFSEGRSVRGSTRVFDRPEFILCDDLETRTSPLGREQATGRIRLIKEAFQSLTNTGTLLVLGNNFDERCAMNILACEQSDGILPANWRVHIFPAWLTESGRPLWPERFPAATEQELQKLLGVSDEAEWLSDFEQTPTPPAGFIFQRLAPLPYYDELPDDARGTVYCDPNLAKRAQGDTTAACLLMYSPSTDLYYADNPMCRSFADSNVLLDAIFGTVVNYRARAIGWDGHVGQESMWSQNVRNYCKIRMIAVPRIEYMRVNVDEYAKNVQMEWNDGRIRISRKFQTPEGQKFLNQMFAFVGKKANKKDDAPDSLICNYVLLHNRHLGRRARATIRASVVNDFYSF